LSGFSEGEFDGINDRLYLLLNEALSGYEGKPREGVWLAVHPVDAKHPESVLGDERYRAVHKVQARIGETLHPF
jgi:hypothetical protein